MSALVALAPASAGAQSAAVEAQYRTWLRDDLWPEARKAGVSEATFRAATENLTVNWDLPDLVPPGTKPKTPKRQTQAEFRSPGAYFSEKTISNLAGSGRALARQHAATLAAVEKRYGVPGRILLAIWGRESGFGRVKIPHNAFDVLGTKAFMATRKDMFRKEMIAALQIVEKGWMPVSGMRSSWAGAMGQPQFLPSSYLQHAVDFDGDGRRDIWNSVPDTLASIANYLAHFGWVKGRDWGFEASVPASVSCAFEGPDQGLTVGDWAGMGVTRINGKPLPQKDFRQPGFLLMPAGRHGPAFVATPNFYVIKAYNESDLYALFIGHVADRIAFGGGAFSAGWGKVGSMNRSDIAAMQASLEAKGYDVGGADGLPGFRTRRSIGDWQAKNGRRETCFPDPDLLAAIR